MEKKNAEVSGLIHALKSDLTSKSLSETRVEEILETLKVHGRDPRGSDAIYCWSGVETLCQYAFNNRPTKVSQAALRVVANALLLQPQLRGQVASPDTTSSLLDVYKRADDNDEFLAGRILFLLTYESKTDFSALIESQGLVAALYEQLDRHARYIGTSRGNMDGFSTMAMMETLKLVFNLASALPDHISSLSSVVDPVCTILSYFKVTSDPLAPPVSTLVNALAILEFAEHSILPTSAEPSVYEKVFPKLLAILRLALDVYDAAQLDSTAVPLVTVLRRVYVVLSAETRTTMQKSLLPDDSERDLPLGKSLSLASRLLRLTSTPSLSNLPESISALLFELSDKDASTFVRNIGYGYAAGYLMTHKIPIPEDAKRTQPGTNPRTLPVNPITGQRLDKEEVSEPVEMTDEEKEREAERLFVLFERLKATGVIDVQNPVELARNQGRFQELEESDSDADVKQ